MSLLLDPPIRQEFEYITAAPAQRGADIAPPPLQRAWRQAWLRKTFILMLLAGLWQAAARWTDNDLLLPSFLQTAQALIGGIASGELTDRIGASLSVLSQGYVAGVLAAFALTALAASTRIGRDLLETLTSMFNPLPAIALLPLALLWFGLGRASLLFVIVHAVLWPLALGAYAGFQGVPATLRMAGRNYGLRGLRFVLQILVPAALPRCASGCWNRATTSSPRCRRYLPARADRPAPAGHDHHRQRIRRARRARAHRDRHPRRAPPDRAVHRRPGPASMDAAATPACRPISWPACRPSASSRCWTWPWRASGASRSCWTNCPTPAASWPTASWSSAPRAC
jgi:NitT/TauT family transport system permease protein